MLGIYAGLHAAERLRRQMGILSRFAGEWPTPGWEATGRLWLWMVLFGIVAAVALLLILNYGASSVGG